MERRGPIVDSLTRAEITSQIQIHTYLSFMALSFLYYDHILTFRMEIMCIWRRSRTASSWWFIAHRYISFSANIVVAVFGFVNLSSKSCKTYHLFRQILLVVQQVIIGILLTLRIYALYGHDKKILGVMVGSFTVLLGIAGWSLVGQHSEPAPGSGCHIASSDKTGVHLSVAWIVLFVYDTLLFCLTVAKTYREKITNDITRSSIPLLTLILRDGAIYFAVMALSNLSNILTFFLAGPLMKGGLSTFASCVSVTMMSRLMLNLHQTASIGIFSDTPTMRSSGGWFLTTGVDMQADTYEDDAPVRSPVIRARDRSIATKSSDTCATTTSPSSSSKCTAVEP